MTLSFVVNPSSGGGRCFRRLAKLRQTLADDGIKHDLQVSTSPEHLRDIVNSIDANADDTVVAVGGDGTNMAVADALLKRFGDEPLPKVGLIPLGRGNSFAKDLPLKEIDDAVAAIVRGRTRPVDVARYEAHGASGHFLNCLGLGFVTDVARTAARLNVLGDVSYVAGVLHRVVELRNHELEIEADGETLRGPACFVEVCNSKNTGGDMVMAPDALIDDGLLDVVWVSRINRRTLLKTFPKIFKGQHGANAAVRFIRCRKMRITSLHEPEDLLPDGDVLGRTPLTVEVLPQRVRYLY